MSNPADDIPLVLGRYLTKRERALLLDRGKDTGPRWSNPRPKISAEGLHLLKRLTPLFRWVLSGSKPFFVSANGRMKWICGYRDADGEWIPYDKPRYCWVTEIPGRVEKRKAVY